MSSAVMIASHHAVLAMMFLANLPAARYAAGVSLAMNALKPAIVAACVVACVPSATNFDTRARSVAFAYA